MQDTTQSMITQRNNRLTVDSLTGEVVDSQELEGLTLLDLYANSVCTRLSSSAPVHIAMASYMMKPDLSNRMQLLRQVSNYSSTDLRSFTDYAGKSVTVIGASIIKHGPYREKKSGEWNPNGYHYLVLKLDETYVVDVPNPKTRKIDQVTKNVYVKVTGQQPCSLFASMIDMIGWFDWPEGQGISCTFSVGGNNNAHCVSING